eukprot:TRINITY_DN5535_c0_g1_i1.p1 TRINITY_DN5535_c0_g1~~TRINITY_DN5535_c0_g1_i1.p1  ORF type:complete len:339 (+),score=80.00 TRINITY_DN5535_c0_g1_i1:152-1018(+)
MPVMGETCQPHKGYWTQTLCECSPASYCLLAFFFAPCYHAWVRHLYDGTDCCFACMTSCPCTTMNIMRHGYGIGSYQECCNDILEGCFCAPCATRRGRYEVDEGAVACDQRNASGAKLVSTSRSGVPVLYENGRFRGLQMLANAGPAKGEQMIWKAGGIGECWGGFCSHTFLYSCFFPQCAAARARSYLDGSDCCFNVVSTTPCGVYGMVRHTYGIRGSCAEDCCLGIWCYSCAIDRAYREIILTSGVSQPQGSCNSCCGGLQHHRGPKPQGQGVGGIAGRIMGALRR